MNIGYIHLDYGEWTNGSYNSQEIGLAKALERICVDQLNRRQKKKNEISLTSKHQKSIFTISNEIGSPYLAKFILTIFT